MLKFKVVIPARYASRRLPGKPLLQIAGKPMLQYVYETALRSGAEDVLVATDDNRIKCVAQGFGASVCITSEEHASGSDRVAEAAGLRGWNDETIVVNLQGDEPLMPAVDIRQVAENLQLFQQADIATLCVPIPRQEEFNDPNVVKVVRDRNDFALYFSRAPIPVRRDNESGDKGSQSWCGYRHIGLYAYRLQYLKIYTRMAPCFLEKRERLEQLRALWRGGRIHVAEALQRPGPGVDTARDLSRVKSLLDS